MAAKAAPARGRSCSPITWRCHSKWVSAAFRRFSRTRAASTDPLHRIRQIGLSGSRRVRVCTGLRRDQRWPRGDDGDRLHPGAAVSHESLPHGRRDASSVARAWSGSNEQSGAVGQLHHHAAEGRACAESCVRCSTSGAHHRRSTGAPRRPVRCKDHRRTLWIWPRLWTTVPDRLRGGASHHERVTLSRAVGTSQGRRESTSSLISCFDFSDPRYVVKGNANSFRDRTRLYRFRHTQHGGVRQAPRAASSSTSCIALLRAMKCFDAVWCAIRVRRTSNSRSRFRARAPAEPVPAIGAERLTVGTPPVPTRNS